MSWQDYVDNQLIASQCVSKACIAGHDGGVWAKSEGFEVSLADDAIKKNLSRKSRKFFFFSFVATRWDDESVSSLFVRRYFSNPVTFKMSQVVALNASKDSRKAVAEDRIDLSPRFYTRLADWVCLIFQ